MPKCLLKYQWVKLPRACMPSGKGIMGYWAKLAAHAAFRKGRAQYCGYTNDVVPGMWSGGIVGLKSILGVKSRTKAIATAWICALHIKRENEEAGICHHRLGHKMLWRRMHERSSLRNRWLWLPLPSPQHYTAACRTTLHIRRIRRMAGSMVPHSLAGDRQCVFLSGTGCPIGTIGCRFDIGSLGTALGLGKDKGMEIFSEAWGCLRSVSSARGLWLSHF